MGIIARTGERFWEALRPFCIRFQDGSPNLFHHGERDGTQGFGWQLDRELYWLTVFSSHLPDPANAARFRESAGVVNEEQRAMFADLPQPQPEVHFARAVPAPFEGISGDTMEMAPGGEEEQQPELVPLGVQAPAGSEAPETREREPVPLGVQAQEVPPSTPPRQIVVEPELAHLETRPPGATPVIQARRWAKGRVPLGVQAQDPDEATAPSRARPGSSGDVEMAGPGPSGGEEQQSAPLGVQIAKGFKAPPPMEQRVLEPLGARASRVRSGRQGKKGKAPKSSTVVRVNEQFLDNEMAAPVVVAMDTEAAKVPLEAEITGGASSSATSGAVVLPPGGFTTTNLPLHRRPNAEALMLADVSHWLDYMPAMGPIMHGLQRDAHG